MLENNRISIIIAVFCRLLFAWKSFQSISDNCFERLLKIIQFFLQLLQLVLDSQLFQQILDIFPFTIYKLKKVIGLDHDNFIKFICCPKCNTLYQYKDALVTDSSGLKRSQLCSFVLFPNHTQRRMREPCGTALMKEVYSISGKEKHCYPYKVYVYQPLKTAIEILISRDEILQELHRSIISHDDDYFDYDGNLWNCLLYTSPSPRDKRQSRMPSSA